MGDTQTIVFIVVLCLIMFGLLVLHLVYSWRAAHAASSVRALLRVVLGESLLLAGSWLLISLILSGAIGALFMDRLASDVPISEDLLFAISFVPMLPLELVFGLMAATGLDRITYDWPWALLLAFIFAWGTLVALTVIAGTFLKLRRNRRLEGLRSLTLDT